MTSSSGISERLRPIGAPGDLIEGVQFTGTAARQSGAYKHRRGGTVELVDPGSPAAAAGIAAGDIVPSVNGHKLRDVVDYQFYAAEAVVNLEVVMAGTGRSRIVPIVRDTNESIGIRFTQPTFAPIRECNNHCPFCFIDQLPTEMRSSLYIRDDDYRYSFLFGNFVTLTNLNEGDWRRLEEQRLSPLYVSVHATDLPLRRLLLGNKRAPDIREQLDRLESIGIAVHTQVVVCPGINDGKHLEQTVTELAARYPQVLTIGVVPVGLTRTPAEILSGPGASCSRLLPSAVDLDMRTFEADEARAVVDQTRDWQRTYRKLHGKSIAYASDEFYLLAGEPMPPARTYDGYPQYENGIGMVRDLLDDWAATKRRIGRSSQGPATRKVTLVCGEMIASVLGELAAEWSELGGPPTELAVIENEFFGPRVKVSGLLTGRDILAQREKLTGDVVILPEVMLDKTGIRLLDNMTPGELEAELGRPVHFAGMMSGVHKIVVAEKG